MQIEQQIQDLFVSRDAVSAPKDTNSEMELKKIEQQLNEHMKSKQGLKYKRVSITHDRFYDEKKFAEVLDDELEKKVMNKTWRTLPMCIKWKMIQDYMDRSNIVDPQEIESIKTRLMSNKLQVEYSNRAVTKII